MHDGRGAQPPKKRAVDQDAGQQRFV